jgi:alpha-tubulin suppressor-like RCC1 family protein
MTMKKPICISSGENHSAAICNKFKLFTWGCGIYGRLGHGVDMNEKMPKEVGDLNSKEMV